VIAFRGFSKRYGAQTAVESLDLLVPRGQVVALLGPNGSGKTTSLKAAAGLLRPSSGEVLLGDPGQPADRPDARRIVSFLPQRVGFPEALTGREVLDFYRELRRVERHRTAEVLHFASLNGAGDRPVHTYSGGMVQRLGLAVAMLPDAPVLLLDEPTAALDPEGLAAFYGVIERHQEGGRTVLFTSHHLGDVERLADRFALLVEGRLVASLTARELTDRLAARGLMRLRLAYANPALLAGVRAFSPDAELAGDELRVPGPPETRPAVLDAVRAAGVEVRGLITQEGRLDDLYRELVGERP
jgi:Cu-processing system ATP-binding protein